MAACFKFSCTIYWGSLLFYIGYVVGLGFYIKTFIPYTAEVHQAELIIELLCYFNICYCMIGIVYVKCDVSHIFYTFCYIGPLLSVNIFGITLGILAVVEANDAYPTLTNVSSVNKFRDAYFRPGWLETVESGGKCCGYWGFWDHPGFIYRNKNFDPKTNNRTVDYIPKQCCKNTDRLDHCQSSMDIPLAQETSKTIRMTLTQLTSHFHCPFPEAEKRVLLEYYKDYSGVFNLNESISVFIHICGCHEFMVNAHAAIYDHAHYVFYVVNSLIALSMFFVYVRNWYLLRVNADTEHDVMEEDDDTW